MNKRCYLLIALFIILLFGFLILENSKVTTYSEDYEIKLEASRLTAQCFEKMIEISL
jgi:spore coat protein CotH